MSINTKIGNVIAVKLFLRKNVFDQNIFDQMCLHPITNRRIIPSREKMHDANQQRKGEMGNL